MSKSHRENSSMDVDVINEIQVINPGNVPTEGKSAAFRGDISHFEAVPYSAAVTLPVEMPADGQNANVDADIEKCPPPDTTSNQNDYVSLCNVVSSDPDLQIFRRFDRTTALNLLYLQGEILDLETHLDKGDAAFSRQRMPREDLRTKDGDQKANETPKTIQRLRELTKDYQEALLRQSQLLQLEPPSRRSWTALSAWFTHFRPLSGNAANLYMNISNPICSDFVALRSPPDQDRLSTFIEDRFGHLFRDRQRQANANNGFPNLYYYQETTIQRLVALVSVLLAAALLIGAIVSLYFVRNNGAKLGMIAAYTLAFAATLGLLTSAKRTDIYASTAAYAAVLVVFISGNFGG